MTIYISAGEASGDAYGAALVTEIKRLSDGKAPIEVWAIGGKRLSEVCDHLVADTSKWGAISVTQTLKILPRVVAKMPGIAMQVRKGGRHEVALAIPIDFGFFNARFARLAKRSGWKVLAFIPPGSWRRNRQAKWAPQIYDAVSTPFSWSAEILTGMGTPNVHWFGHPLKQLLRDRIAAADKIARLDQMAIMPGSRHHELQLNLPLIAASLPEAQGEFALAAGTDADAFMRRWKALAPGRNDLVTVGDSAGVLLRSRAAVVCSGTATLEAAVCRCPMTVIYSVSKVMHFESRLLGVKRPKFVALPNILLDRMLVDEYVGYEAIPENVRPSLARLYADGPTRQAQLDGFTQLDDQLGSDDAITQTATLALQMMGIG